MPTGISPLNQPLVLEGLFSPENRIKGAMGSCLSILYFLYLKALILTSLPLGSFRPQHSIQHEAVILFFAFGRGRCSYCSSY